MAVPSLFTRRLRRRDEVLGAHFAARDPLNPRHQAGRGDATARAPRRQCGWTTTQHLGEPRGLEIVRGQPFIDGHGRSPPSRDPAGPRVWLIEPLNSKIN
jgi:hypothetical protein